VTDIGTILGGRYRLVELLGQGGMATIYRARDNQLERDVAVKILRPEYGADPDFIDRFRHEAQSAASLNHPGIVAVYDYGTDPAGPFIVMELVEGEDIATIIRRTGALPPRAAARLIAQAARGLATAHDRGFVHRDVKPGNMLVTREGRVKVADFGIARALSESALTLPGTTLGSVHYFSPEQARGELATPASDIYSLGIVLYELLTGRRPWTGDTAAAIATARLTGAVPSPSAAHGGIPPTLEGIVRKALAPNPDERFESAAAMADALESFLGEERRPDGAIAPRAAGLGVAGAAGAAAAGAGAGPTAASGGALGAAGAGGAAAGAAAAGAAAAGAAGATAGAAGAAGEIVSPPTIAAGVARPNPNARIDYPRDAYAGAPSQSARTSGRSGGPPDDEDDARSGGGPWLWVSALLAIGVLALAAFLVSRILGGPTESPQAQVVVPNLIGKTFDEARQIATEAGLMVEQAGFEQSSASINTVIKQDPAEGALVDAGSPVLVTIAIGAELTVVPDLRLKTETEALNLIAQAGLAIGARSESFDPIVPVLSIVSHVPGPGQSVARGTPVAYVVSKGPEPTPTPAPTPTPPPPPPPTQNLKTVGDYQCRLLLLAQGEITNNELTVGTISGPNAPESWVIWQDPAPGSKRPPGTAIDLWTVDQPAPTTCPQAPG
jgi:beta-lactam-binding protein with PASTA domain